MGCASVLAVWDLVWVILGWKWSRVPQPSVRHSHNFKSIKSSFHKQHLNCQRQARRANGRANANATTSRRSVTHIYYINWAVKNQMNSTKRRENVRKRKSQKRSATEKQRGAWSCHKSDWLAGRQGDTDRQLPSIPDDTVLARCATYLLDAKNTWQG